MTGAGPTGLDWTASLTAASRRNIDSGQVAASRVVHSPHFATSTGVSATPGSDWRRWRLSALCSIRPSSWIPLSVSHVSVKTRRRQFLILNLNFIHLERPASSHQQQTGWLRQLWCLRWALILALAPFFLDPLRLHALQTEPTHRESGIQTL